jgi:hypothetical protein
VSPDAVPEPTGAFGAADRPQQSQLFDPSRLKGDASRSETPSRASRSETPPPSSRIETRGEDAPDSPGLLQAIAEAAALVADAQRRLDAAIEAARAAGCSWRQIGTAAGAAYQSLHRRRRQGPAT